MSTFVLEIGSEELPARFVPQALAGLADRARTWFKEHHLPCGTIRTAGTPRRLVLEIAEVAERQQDWVREAKGPAVKTAYGPDGQPTKAASGFARSQNVPVESLIRKKVAGGEFVFAVQRQAGQPALDVLREFVSTGISHIALLRGMRWGDTQLRFERPLRWILALLDEAVVSAQVDGLASGRTTYGHRFLADRSLVVPGAAQYRAILEQAHVHVDPAARARLIEQQVEQAAAAVGGRIHPDLELLEEVTFLVENPLALLGNFDRNFLEIPDEVSTTVMKHHQRYFPMYDAQDRLLPHFVVVTNGSGDPRIVQAGNERVLRARLSDASFFYDEDLKTPLERMVDSLRQITFMEGLGSLYDKIGRLRSLARMACDMLGEASPEAMQQIDRAALLCKADLPTHMVRELTELQGVMGRHYARLAGEPEAVAQAIYEHYLPTGPASPLPQTPLGVALSLAEKFDNLAACFSRGLVPSGSQDPFALRRQASGIVLMSWERDRHLDALALLRLAAKQVEASPEASRKLEEFLLGRLRAHLLERDLRHDLVDAALGSGHPLQDLLLPKLKAHTLQEWLGAQPEMAERTIFAADRVTRLAAVASSTLIDEALFEKDSEGALFARLQAVDAAITPLLSTHDYLAILEQLSHLNDAVERFFDFHDGVFVMVKDNPPLQRNRLGLLKRLSDLYANMADFRVVAVKRTGEWGVGSGE